MLDCLLLISNIGKNKLKLWFIGVNYSLVIGTLTGWAKLNIKWKMREGMFFFRLKENNLLKIQLAVIKYLLIWYKGNRFSGSTELSETDWSVISPRLSSKSTRYKGSFWLTNKYIASSKLVLPLLFIPTKDWHAPNCRYGNPWSSDSFE